MKTMVTSFLLFCCFPFMLTAQPTVTNNEFYHIGDVIRMVPCDASAISAGPQGANVTWNFSALSSTGGMSVTSIINDTSAVFLTANIMMVLPNGSALHIQESSSESFILGLEDAATHQTTYYNEDYSASQRPFTYNTAYLDTYLVTIPATATTGRGYQNVRGDAYGTLILPTGTFSNVLRIRKYRTETDTTGPAVVTTTTTSYMWFDNAHAAPLFRIDSVSAVSGNTQSAMYLALPTAVQGFGSSTTAYSGTIVNSTLRLNGVFEDRAQYQVSISNIIGTRIFNERFVATGAASYKFDIGSHVSPGLYIVSIARVGNPSDGHVFRVFKN